MASFSKANPAPDILDDPDLRAKDAKDEARLKAEREAATKAKAEQEQDAIPRGKPTQLVTESEPAPEQQYDEVAAGSDIPWENVQMLIAGTLGGGGDQHADAARIVNRMQTALWVITKGTTEGVDALARRKRKEEEDERKRQKADDDKDAKSRRR